ncbi:MAG: tetratricopeptide repeat protein [Nannocystaceae bacterium]|nr:tetratricopeptide repeat protein [bacterium]
MASEDDTQGTEAEGAEDVMFNEGEDDPEAVAQAAADIKLVILPFACTNEGKGAPLAMGVQRWWAQELATREVQAAAPVFTAMADQGGRQVPALMVFREPWTDERALEGIGRFPNATFGLVTDIRVDEENIALTSRLVERTGEAELTERGKWSWGAKAQELPERMLGVLADLAKHFDTQVEETETKAAFGTDNQQALMSFLVGLGNLSALQGRCIPTTPDQLLTPFVDAINRDPGMDNAMQGLHMMADILVNNPFDQTAVPLSLQALSVAAQKRKEDKQAWHHLATLFRRLGDAASAVQHFNQAFNLDPTDETITTQFIDTLRAAGDNANALKVAEFAAEKGNESPLLMARIGSLLIEHDKFDEAEPFLRRAVDEGKVPAAYGDLANVLWDRAGDDDDQGKEDREEAMQLLRTAVTLDGIGKSSLDMLLDLHEDEGIEEATKLLHDAAERFSQSATVLRYVASMYLDDEDSDDAADKAKGYLEKILALPRRSLDDDAFARRGMLQVTVENFDDRYDEAMEQVRSGDKAQATEAAKFLREVIATDEKFWQPHLMLALAVRESEGDAAALAHLNNAVKLRPNDAEIRNLLAAILRKQGRPKEAVEHLRAVVAINPRDIEPVVALASTMRDANMFDEARQVCQAALQAAPNHPEFTAIMAGLPAPKQPS